MLVIEFAGGNRQWPGKRARQEALHGLDLLSTLQLIELPLTLMMMMSSSQQVGSLVGKFQSREFTCVNRKHLAISG